jgi:hypothetical protein
MRRLIGAIAFCLLTLPALYQSNVTVSSSHHY